MVFINNFSIVKIFLLLTVSFIFTIAWTPLLTHYLYKYKLGKKIRSSQETPIYNKLHQAKTGTPTLGGMLIWVTTFILAVIIFYFHKFTDINFFDKINFLTRSQTLLPLGVLVASAAVGLFDDFLNIFKIGPHGGGLRVRHKIIIYAIIAAVGAWWFFYKLDWDVVHIPFWGNFSIGWWYMLLFIFIIVSTAFSVNEADGLDGLAGGVLLTGFAAFGAIAFVQGKYELATFCGVIVGALLAFLWFNIHPARFFMGDTGSMSLGVTLGVVAMLTNEFLLLPLIGFVLVLESISVIIQVISKKLRKGKKIFLSTPIHHHFEAIGWPETKIVMRFWIIAAVTATLGLIVALMDQGWF